MHGSVLPKLATGYPRWQLFQVAKSKYGPGQECMCEHAFIWSRVRLWWWWSKHLQTITKPPSKNPVGAESTVSPTIKEAVYWRELPNKMTTSKEDWWSRANSKVVVFNCISRGTLSSMAFCLHSFSKSTARSPPAAISCCPQSLRGFSFGSLRES